MFSLDIVRDTKMEGKKIHVLKQYCDLSINKKLCINFMFLYFVNVDKGVMFNLINLIMLLSLQGNENFSNLFKDSLSGKDCPGQKFCRAALAFYSTQSIFTNLGNSKSVFIISWFPWVRSSGIVKGSSVGNLIRFEFWEQIAFLSGSHSFLPI